ncbi:hypothetical protein GF407_18120 [candidate division KSB1 bacterium]|nr:hypothetical protein [candidate division KSB1 bacterium]
MKLIKPFFTAVFVLTVSSLIFLFVSKDKVFKEKVLVDTLDTVGQKFLTTIRDREERSQTERVYSTFLQKVDNEEIPSKEIERVAASLLNTTSRDTCLSGEDAIKILESSAPSLFESSRKSGTFVLSPPPKGTSTYRKAALPKGEQKRLAERIQNMSELQEMLQKVTEKQENRFVFYFQADSGLRVVMNKAFKDSLIYSCTSCQTDKEIDIENGMQAEIARLEVSIEKLNEINAVTYDSLLRMEKLGYHFNDQNVPPPPPINVRVRISDDENI